MSLKAAEKETAVPPKEVFLSIDDPRLAFITNKWSRTIVQPLLISLLFTALLSAVLVFAEIVTDTNWMPFSTFLFFVCLEGCYTTLWLQQPERRLLNHTAYRAAELLLLALLLRAFAWSVSGSGCKCLNTSAVVHPPAPGSPAATSICGMNRKLFMPPISVDNAGSNCDKRGSRTSQLSMWVMKVDCFSRNPTSTCSFLWT